MDDIQLVATIAGQLIAEWTQHKTPSIVRNATGPSFEVEAAVTLARAIVAESQRQFRDALPDAS